MNFEGEFVISVILAILILMTITCVVFLRKWLHAKSQKEAANRMLMGISAATTAKVVYLANRLDLLAPHCQPGVGNEVLRLSSNLKDLLSATQEGMKTSLETSSGRSQKLMMLFFD